MAQTFVNLKDNENDFRLCPRRFSDWTRLLRISAWVQRLIDNSQAKKGEKRLSPELSVLEMEHSEKRIISQAQLKCFGDEYDCLEKGKTVSLKNYLPLIQS